MQGLTVDRGRPPLVYGFTPEDAASVVFGRLGPDGDEEHIVEDLIDAGDGVPPVVVAEVEAGGDFRFLDVDGNEVDYENQIPLPEPSVLHLEDLEDGG